MSEQKRYNSYQDILDIEKKQRAVEQEKALEQEKTLEQWREEATRYREALELMSTWDPEHYACKISREALGLPEVKVILYSSRKLRC